MCIWVTFACSLSSAQEQTKVALLEMKSLWSKQIIVQHRCMLNITKLNIQSSIFVVSTCGWYIIYLYILNNSLYLAPNGSFLGAGWHYGGPEEFWIFLAKISSSLCFDLLPQPALYCMQPKAAVQWWLVVGQQMILMREQRCKHCDFTRGADKGERTGCSDALVISNSCHGQGLEI